MLKTPQDFYSFLIIEALSLSKTLSCVGLPFSSLSPRQGIKEARYIAVVPSDDAFGVASHDVSFFKWKDVA